MQVPGLIGSDYKSKRVYQFL